MEQLNDNQIEQLFEFVKSKYVRYIDVQYELVDHLATDIASEMNSDNSLSFDKALQKVYSKFPISGFSNYVSESEKAIGKFWRKKIYGELFAKRGIPLIVSLTLLITIQYLLFKTFGTPMIIAAIVLVFAADIKSTYRLRKMIEAKHQEKYLVVNMFMSAALIFSIMPALIPNLIIDLATVKEFTEASLHYRSIGFAMLLSTGIIWTYLVYFRFPNLIKEVLRTKYAHLNLSV